jgi:hypothetical protein
MRADVENKSLGTGVCELVRLRCGVVEAEARVKNVQKNVASSERLL